MIPLQKGPKYWIEKNAKRFVYPPSAEQMDNGLVSVTFSGLNPNLMLRILETGEADAFLYLSVGSPDIDSEDEIVDIVYDDIITIRMNTDGKFYCGVCPDPEYYSTPDALWTAHTLDNIIKWINSFRQDECYVFFVTEGAVGADRIKKSDAKNKKSGMHAFPSLPACSAGHILLQKRSRRTQMYSNILTINDQRFIEKTGLHELTKSWRLSLIHPCTPGRIFLFQHGQRNAHSYSFIPNKKDVKIRVVGQPDTVSDTSIQIICNLAYYGMHILDAFGNPLSDYNELPSDMIQTDLLNAIKGKPPAPYCFFSTNTTDRRLIMSKAALKQLSDQLDQLQAEGQTDTEEYESLSDDYQSLAMSMLPTWTEQDDESE